MKSISRCCRGPNNTSGLRFLLTSCMHIYCSRCCTASTQQPGCIICSAPQPRLFPIGADLPKEARSLFSSMEEMTLLQFGKVGGFRDSQVSIDNDEGVAMLML